MILKPAWKLMNFHLPVFTEVLGYGATLSSLVQEEEETVKDVERGYESEDEEEIYGVTGMTLQLIELLTTLVSRPNV